MKWYHWVILGTVVAVAIIGLLGMESNAWDKVAIFISLAAVAFAGYAGYLQNKQQKLSAILEVFRILNDPEHREARENVYSAFKQYEQGQNKIFKNDPYHKNAAMVRADLDQIGMLFDRSLISKDMFLKVYWHTVLACWIALEDNIGEEIVTRGNPTYMTYFELLDKEAEKYRKKHHPEVKVKVYSADDSNL